MKNRRKAVQPFEIKKRKIDIFRNYEAYGFEKNQRKFENFSTLISKKSIAIYQLVQFVLKEFNWQDKCSRIVDVGQKAMLNDKTK